MCRASTLYHQDSERYESKRISRVPTSPVPFTSTRLISQPPPPIVVIRRGRGLQRAGEQQPADLELAKKPPKSNTPPVLSTWPRPVRKSTILTSVVCAQGGHNVPAVFHQSAEHTVACCILALVKISWCPAVAPRLEMSEFHSSRGWSSCP